MAYKILLAEDEPTMRRLMGMLLGRQGHQVIEAENGAPVVDLAQQHQPDLILLDIMMPVVDGFETLRRIRATPGIDDIPVIFLSAKSQIEDRVEGLRMGADDYLIKPADPNELMARIDSVMLRSRREARRVKGKVFGFMGAKGGVGVTTVVVNMALYLHQLGRAVLAGDMHLAFGGLADRLGMDPPQTTANLALLSADAIEGGILQKVLTRHSSGLSVLASPANVPSGVTYSADHLIAIAEQAAYAAQFVMLDLPNDPDIIEVLADQLSGIVLVSGSEPTSLRAAQRWARHLGHLGLHDRLSSLLVHRQGQNQQYATAATVTEKLGCLFLGDIPCKPDLYFNAEYTQTPVLLNQKESPERAVYQSIAQKLTDYADILEQFHKTEILKSDRLL
ncbi:MAG: response regulator [Caldilineaceae bacterium]|mgnify:CR=1 FL=1|nr:response regulator [Caldilineaceae bacterium]HRJ42126.1 response regulator [Caldilineaceae bacterium]